MEDSRFLGLGSGHGKQIWSAGTTWSVGNHSAHGSGTKNGKNFIEHTDGVLT